MSYIEPAPILDHANPLDSMMERFHKAAEHLGLDDDIYNVLKAPARQVIVSLPISMDNGDIKVFQGYRVIHSNILGIVWFLIDRSSLLRKIPDRQLMSESINFNSFSNISGLAHEPWR